MQGNDVIIRPKTYLSIILIQLNYFYPKYILTLGNLILMLENHLYIFEELHFHQFITVTIVHFYITNIPIFI